MWLSTCCEAKIIGEVFEEYGRCSDCKEMSKVFDDKEPEPTPKQVDSQEDEKLYICPKARYCEFNVDNEDDYCSSQKPHILSEDCQRDSNCPKCIPYTQHDEVDRMWKILEHHITGIEDKLSNTKDAVKFMYYAKQKLRTLHYDKAIEDIGRLKYKISSVEAKIGDVNYTIKRKANEKIEKAIEILIKLKEGNNAINK